MRSLSSHSLRTGLVLLPLVLASCVVHVRHDPYYRPAPAPVAVAAAPAPVAAAPAEVAYEEPAPVDVDTFTEPLAAYGEWIDGEWGRVWRPYPNIVGADFTPYSTGGHWVWTDVGWTFESEYDWGWAPFHYGRWANSDAGWVWIPGTTWGPAWVDWRYGNGYTGWAPMGPPGYVYPEHHWLFVENQHFANPRFHEYLVGRERVHALYAGSAAIAYAGRFHPNHPFGPPRGEIERAYGHPVTAVHAGSANIRPGTLPSHHVPPQYRGHATEAVHNPPPQQGHAVEAVHNNPPPQQGHAATAEPMHGNPPPQHAAHAEPAHGNPPPPQATHASQPPPPQKKKKDGK